MPSSHLSHCRPLLLLPSMFPSIKVFSSESVVCIRSPKDWSFSFSPSSEYSGQIKIKTKTKTTKSPQMPSLGRSKASQPEKAGGTPSGGERCSEDLLWAGLFCLPCKPIARRFGFKPPNLLNIKRGLESAGKSQSKVGHLDSSPLQCSLSGAVCTLPVALPAYPFPSLALPWTC